MPAEIHGTKDRINSIPVDAVYTPCGAWLTAWKTPAWAKDGPDRSPCALTDGSVEPRDALDMAVETLRNQLNVFSGNGVRDEEAAPS